MSNFKVIVVGGGPVGLTAAHALSKAGIDYIVLEARPQIAEDVGASLVLFPHTIRLFAQLGMLDRVRNLGHEVMRWAEYNEKSRVQLNWPGETIRKNLGSVSFMCHRAELVQCLYDCLGEEDKARVHLHRRVAGVESTADGVVVTCEDGSTYAGAMVLGADGVHSRVRSIMREQALRAGGGADVDEEVPFPAEYKTMWCTVPRRYEFEPGDHHVTHGQRASLQYLNASRRGWVFVYEKLEGGPTRERVRYTEEDMAAFVARHGDMKIGGRLRLRDVVGARTAAGMANLEEGVLRQWSHGRVVLAGDAAHKYTPNAGQGLNTGIQDVAALVNGLHGLVRAAAAGGPGLSQGELTAVFQRYQEERVETVERGFKVSAYMTRLCAWPSTLWWFLDQWVLPNIPFGNYLQLQYLFCPTLAKGLPLDFLEGEEPFSGKMPWVHPIPKPKTGGKASAVSDA